MPPKGRLIDLAFLRARERHPKMLQLIDRLRGLTAQIFYGVLIAEPVGTFDRVIHMPAPIIFPHIAQSRGDAPLSRHRMRTSRKDFCNTRGLQPLLGAPQSRTQTRTPRHPPPPHQRHVPLEDRPSSSPHLPQGKKDQGDLPDAHEENAKACVAPGRNLLIKRILKVVVNDRVHAQKHMPDCVENK